MNRPWADWLAAAGIEPAWVWPHAAASARSLWNARLYPVLADRDESLRLALPLQDPAAAPAGWLAAWQSAPRLSLAESSAQADGPRLLAELATLEDTVAARPLLRRAVAMETPAAEARTLLGNVPAAVHAPQPAASLETLSASDTLLQLRGFKALAEATGDHAWEDRAFNLLAEMIEKATFERRWTLDRRPATRDAVHSSIPKGGFALVHRHIRVRAAARIDFGGGWTDTPPYSIERGGTVLNAALTLRGSHPIDSRSDPVAGAAPGVGEPRYRRRRWSRCTWARC